MDSASSIIGFGMRFQYFLTVGVNIYVSLRSSFSFSSFLQARDSRAIPGAVGQSDSREPKLQSLKQKTFENRKVQNEEVLVVARDGDRLMTLHASQDHEWIYILLKPPNNRHFRAYSRKKLKTPNVHRIDPRTEWRWYNQYKIVETLSFRECFAHLELLV